MVDLLGLYLVLSTSFTVGKAALQACTPIAFVGIRMMLSGLLLMFFCRVGGISLAVSGTRNVLLFSQISAFHIYFAYVLEFLSLSVLPSSTVALAYNTTPFITALLTWIYSSKCPSKSQFVGLLLGLVGIIPLAYQQLYTLRMVNGPAYGVLFLSVISSCYGWILVKDAVVTRGYSPFTVNAWSMLIGGTASSITAFFLEEYPFISISNTVHYSAGLLSVYTASFMRLLTSLVMLIFISNVFFYNAYGYLLRAYSTTLLSFGGFITPLYAALFGYVFLDERITSGFLLSMVCMGIGLYIFYRDEIMAKKETTLQKT